MGVDGMMALARRERLLKTATVAAAARSGVFKHVYMDAPGRLVGLNSVGLTPARRTLYMMNLCYMLRGTGDCVTIVMVNDCRRNERKEKAFTEAGIERGTGPIFEDDSDNLQAASDRFPELFTFERAVTCEGEAQVVGHALADHEATGRSFTIMSLDSDNIFMPNLPPSTIIASFPRDDQVTYLVIGDVLAWMEFEQSIRWTMHSMVRSDLFRVMKGAGVTTLFEAFNGLKVEHPTALQLLELAVEYSPRAITLLPNAQRDVQRNYLNFSCARIVDETGRLVFLSAPPPGTTIQDLLDADVYMDDFGPNPPTAAMLLDMQKGRRNVYSPYAFREPAVDPDLGQVFDRWEVLRCPGADPELADIEIRVLDWERKIDEVEDAMLQDEDMPRFYMTGPNATWRQRLAHYTYAQINHIIYTQMPKDRLRALMSRLNIVNNDTRTADSQYKYQQLEEGLAIFIDRHGGEQDLRTYRSNYSENVGPPPCWATVAAICQELNLESLVGLTPFQLNSLFCNWNLVTGSTAKQDHWIQRSKEAKAAAGGAYLVGGALRKSRTNAEEKYEQATDLFVKYAQEHYVRGPACNMAQLDMVVNRLALLPTNDACYEEMVARNWLDPYPRLRGLNAKQMKSVLYNLQGRKHLWQRVADAREAARRPA